MNTKHLERSLKDWKKKKNRGAIVHQAEMINEQIHIRTIRIRECKEGMKEADRIHGLMRARELERLAEMNESHLADKRMVNLCMKYIKKGKKYDLKEPEAPVIEKTPEPEIIRKKHPSILPAIKSGTDIHFDEPKKEFIPPDPVKEIVEEPEWVPPPPLKIELTLEEKKAIKQQQLEAKIAELEAEAEFPCPHCGKIYATEPARKRHITMRHKEV